MAKVTGYQREVLVPDDQLEVLAERAAVTSTPDSEETALPVAWTRAEMLALLTRRQARVIELVFWQGLTVSAAAKRLHIHRGAAGRRYRNALERLGQRIGPPDSPGD